MFLLTFTCFGNHFIRTEPTINGMGYLLTTSLVVRCVISCIYALYGIEDTECVVSGIFLPIPEQFDQLILKQHCFLQI